MPRYEVIFTRDVIQTGTLLVEAESSQAALDKAKQFGPHDVNRNVTWSDDQEGAPYAIAVSDEPT